MYRESSRGVLEPMRRWTVPDLVYYGVPLSRGHRFCQRLSGKIGKGKVREIDRHTCVRVFVANALMSLQCSVDAAVEMTEIFWERAPDVEPGLDRVRTVSWGISSEYPSVITMCLINEAVEEDLGVTLYFRRYVPKEFWCERQRSSQEGAGQEAPQVAHQAVSRWQSLAVASQDNGACRET